MGSQSSSSSPSVIHCFIFFISIGFTAGLPDQQHCNPSSCGEIQIAYPFRLKGNPQNCGDPNYELTCSGNRTFMEFHSSQYSVKQIDYDSKSIQVIEIGLLRSNCSLPLKSLSATSMLRSVIPPASKYYHLYRWSWIGIMNCSKKLLPQKYQLFPCQTRSDSYLYGVSGYLLEDLAPSCSFFSMMPRSDDLRAPTDLFQAIHEGFSLSWNNQGFTTAMLIRECLRQSSSKFWDNYKASNFLTFVPAVFKAEMHVPACFEDYTAYAKIFRLSICVIVIIEIVQIIIILVVLGRFVFAPLTLCFFLAHKFWSNWASEDAVEKFLKTQQNLSPTRYAYTDLVAITRNFREQLGRGGFGSVYKGELPGRHFIAVKLLTANSKCNGDEFISEVSTIGRIHHLNIVRLLGFCSDGSKRALVYEYMSNGSLEKYIFSADKTPKHFFSWKKLNSIALAVARGIDYLHRGCDMMILHFDIKPQNILLDRNFNPKVADFGLARLYPKEHNVVSVSVARGTIGYIAPELVSRNFGLISDRSDVYSFGMLLLEMGSGRRNIDTRAGSSSQVYYPSLIYDKLSDEVGEGIGFEYSSEMNEVEKKMYMVGLWCIQIRPSDRPSMSRVVQMLEGDADALQLPPKPFMSWSSSPPRSRRLHSDNTAASELRAIDEDDSS